ncbi:MAG TPA: GNAT family protein [Pyrinomonadaceae bacterium]|nr:GNAT family protein [Pyrinomonadaceae bacterium]
MRQPTPNAKIMIKGERVYLRPPQKRDAAEFIDVNRRSVAFHRGLASPPSRPDQFAAFLKRSKQPDSAVFLICRTEDNAIMGSIALSQIFRGGFLSAYLGYQIGEKFARKGYMTEAIQLMLRHAFLDLKLHRVEANIQPGNVASIALVKRAGFVREGYSQRYLKIGGRWRDHERWAILVENWRRTSRRISAFLGDLCD